MLLTSFAVGGYSKNIKKMYNNYNCMICEAELEYLEKPLLMTCAICGNQYESNVWCKNHHYVCDHCHAESANDLIMSVCLRTTSKNPIEIAMRLMDHPQVHMHGPEHHVLVGSALLAAYKNAGGDIDIEVALKEMRRRGEQVPGGACGNWGACGAAISTGIYMSLITNNSPLQSEAWSRSNNCTACALNDIAQHNGPRCCKRDSFIAILRAVQLTKEYASIMMETTTPICHYSHKNKTCLGDQCPWHAN